MQKSLPMKDDQSMRGAPFPLPVDRVFQTGRAVISMGEVLQYHTVVLANDFCSATSTFSLKKKHLHQLMKDMVGSESNSAMVTIH